MLEWRMRLAPEPTRALPGTEEKIEVMRWRVAHDYQPFHPHDATYDDMSHTFTHLYHPLRIYNGAEHA